MTPSRIDDESSPTATEYPNGKPTVYVLDTFHPDAITHAQTLFHTILPSSPKHADWRSKAQYLLMRSSHLTATDIDSCPNLLAIGKQGVGIDKIDAAACQKRGIKILNTPGANARAVAELVLSLVSSIARDIPRISVRQAAGERVPKETCNGLILHQRSIGVIGMGHIGKVVAKIFDSAFEAPIIAYDPFMPSNAWSDFSHKRADTLEELLAEADVVSTHVPLTPKTRHLITYRELCLMKSTAILVNASRGGIINEDDLERGLREGLIFGAALDCHEQEPPTKDKYERMWAQRVVSTPHIGAATSQTQKETAVAAIDALYRFAMSQGQSQRS